MSFRKIFLILAAMTLICRPGILQADDKIKIAATTSTFGSIAQSITGEKAEIYVIASPRQNIHFTAPTPKDVLKTRKADVFIHGGVDLEIWRNPLLDAAGRTDFISGQRAIDVSTGISLLEIPHDLSRLEGDVHAHGNPHYWLDPENGKNIARNIAERLSSLYPEHAESFQGNLDFFTKQLDEKIQVWENRLALYKGIFVVCYHNSWPYFLNRFSFKTLGFLEPKPGIPPTPKHIKNMIDEMNKHSVKVIIRQVFHESRTPLKIEKATGARTVVLASEPGEIPGDYLAMMEHNVSVLEKALK